MRHWFLAVLVAGLAAPAAAQTTPPQTPAPPAVRENERIDYRPDGIDRMTVPVLIHGQGPYRFIVDTGAERTVISRELADALRLSPGPDVTLVSLADVQQVQTVLIPSLGVGRRTVDTIHAPALAEANLGAQGMLGVDSLANQRIVFDFHRREMVITRSLAQEDRVSDGEIVVTARTRLGRMVLADVLVEGQRVQAIVDTGSPVTIGNEALRRRLIGQGRLDPNQFFDLTSVTGTHVRVPYTIARRIRVGGAQITQLPMAFSDLELFNTLGLQNRPALLLGMDTLRLFRRVSIDFASRRLRLLPESSVDGGTPIRMASAR